MGNDPVVELFSGDGRPIREVSRNQWELQHSQSPPVNDLTLTPSKKGGKVSNGSLMVHIRHDLSKGEDDILVQSEFGILQGWMETLEGGLDSGDGGREARSLGGGRK